MAVYTVHEPPPKQYELAPDPERFTFVRDGFSLSACMFAPLWMLWHRMWLVLFGYVVVVAALEAVFRGLGTSGGARFVAGALLALLIGLEAPTLRRLTLARHKWSNVGVIVGDDLEDAERRFFNAWTKAGQSTLPAPGSHLVGPEAEPDVIGLFPLPGAHR